MGFASCLPLICHVLSPHLVLPISYAGQLSLDEFIDGARKDKWVMKMLQMDVNPGGWISEQRRKSALFWENSVLIQLKMWCWLQLWLSCSRVTVALLFNTISASRWKLQWFKKPYLNLKPVCCILLVPRDYFWPVIKSFCVHNTVSASSGFWLYPKEQTSRGFLQQILGRVLVWWQMGSGSEKSWCGGADSSVDWCLHPSCLRRYKHTTPKVMTKEVLWQALYSQGACTCICRLSTTANVKLWTPTSCYQKWELDSKQ